MLVQRFIEWSRTAPVSDRVRTVERLCGSFRFANLPEKQRQTAAAVMTVALDDRSERVRLALAEGIAACTDAPRHVVLSLARDLPAIATTVMASPLLEEGDLLQFVRAGDEACTLAIAGRVNLSAELACAIVRHGQAEAVAKVLDHPGLILSADMLEHVAERFGSDADIRTRLLRNESLRPETRRRLRDAHAASLCAFAAERNWISGKRADELVVQERESRFLEAASATRGEDLSDLLVDATEDGTLTSALLLRAAVGGQLDLVERAIALLCDIAPGKVAAAFGSRRASALQALVLRAGIAADAGQMIEAAHAVWRNRTPEPGVDGMVEGIRVLRAVVRRLNALVRPTTQPAIVRLLADLELQVERSAALDHTEQTLLAA